MKALILAAGKGERVRPITDNRPKAMVPLVGQPVMQYLLEDLVKLGIRDLVVVVGYMSDMVKRHFGDGSKFGANISYVHQKRLTGEAEAILCAEELLSNEESFLVTLGDFMADPKMIEEAVQVSRRQNADITLGLTKVADPTHYGVVALEADNRITAIVEKPSINAAPSNIAAAGVYVFKPTIFDVLRRVRHLERGMARMIKTGARAYGSVWTGEWIDVGRPWDMLRANRFLLERVFQRQKGKAVCESPVPSTAKITPPAYIGPNVRIMENALVKESYIDSGSTVGTNALIRNYSYVGKGCTAGYTCEIRNSIVMDGTQVGHLVFLGDSVVGERCEVGAGTITANLRFDRRNIKMDIAGKKIDTGLDKFGAVIGDDVQIGVNVSIYPGRKIGSGAWVGPGVVVASDIRRDARILVAQRTKSLSLSSDRGA